jgi:hypothetical protein
LGSTSSRALPRTTTRTSPACSAIMLSWKCFGNRLPQEGQGARQYLGYPSACRSALPATPARRSVLEPNARLYVVDDHMRSVNRARATLPASSSTACATTEGVHVQPDTRTLNNHRRPPNLQMWLYQRECSPTPATHESFCSTRPSGAASPHTNLCNGR